MGRDAVESDENEGARDSADGLRTDATLVSGGGIDPVVVRNGGHTLGRVTSVWTRLMELVTVVCMMTER